MSKGRYALKKLLWTIIILSTLATGLVNFVLPDVFGRPIVLLWFLSVCPGMVLIRFLQLKEPIVVWTLAIALSLAIDAVTAGTQMYSGHWSPSITLAILMGICIIGALIQILQISAKSTESVF